MVRLGPLLMAKIVWFTDVRSMTETRYSRVTPRLSSTSPAPLRMPPASCDSLGNKLQRLAIANPLRMAEIADLVEKYLAEAER